MASGEFLKLNVTALRMTLPIWGILWIAIDLSIPAFENQIHCESTLS